MNPQTLGEHIKRRRIDLGWTQKKVAEILHVTDDTITYWEVGRSKPRASYYCRIIQFLGYLPTEMSELTVNQ